MLIFTKDENKEELRKHIYELNQRKGFLACNYCDEGTDEYKPIPPAEQIMNRIEIDKWKECINKQ